MGMKLASRKLRVDREGSPFFKYTLPNIPPNGLLSIEYEDISPSAQKYFPLDFIEITNNAGVGLIVELSPGQKFICPAGTIKTINDRPITMLRVENMDGTVATGINTIVFALQRLAITEDRKLRRGI